MAQNFPHFHIVLLCQDYGSRLWPIAREQAPACLASAGPDSHETLLSATVRRVMPFTDTALHVVTTEALAPLIEGELEGSAHLTADDFELLIEPVERGGAFAIALACAYIRRKDPDAVVAVFPADQTIEVDDRWEHLIFHAYQVALRDRIVLVGGQQEQKCRDASYIKRSRPFENIDNSYEVRVFKADVPATAAARAHAEGAFWYTGLLVSRAAVAIGELQWAGDMGKTAETQVSGRIAETANFLAQLEPRDWLTEDARKVMAALPYLSYEKAVLEVSDKLVVVPTTLNFTTLTSLSDLDTVLPTDRSLNRTTPNALTVDSRGTTVYSEQPDRAVVTLGLRDVLVVDTPDALFVAQKEHLRNMDNALEAMRMEQTPQLTSSARHPFPWGAATLLNAAESHSTWRVELHAGASMEGLSVPMACEAFGPLSEGLVRFREQYVVAEGDVTIWNADDENPSRILMGAGDAFEVDPGDDIVIACVEEASAIILLTAIAAV